MVVTRPPFLLRVCQSRSRFLEVKSISPSFRSILGDLVDRSGHGSAGAISSWLVCPSARGPRRCCFGLLAQTVAVSLVGSSSFAVSFGRLVASRVVCLDGRQGNGSLKNPYRLGVDFPWRCRTLPWAEERTHTTTSCGQNERGRLSMTLESWHSRACRRCG